MPRRATAALLLACTAAADGQWTVVQLHPAGAGTSYASGIGDGQIAGRATFGGWEHAALWYISSGTFVDLHPPSNPDDSSAFATVFGTQAGGARSAGQIHAATWQGSFTTITDLNPLGAGDSYIVGETAIQQAGYASFGGVYHAGRKRVVGSQRIVNLYANLGKRASNDARVEVRTLNGLPAIVGEDPAAGKPNAPRWAILIDLDREGRVRRFYSVIAPAKLAALRWPVS